MTEREEGFDGKTKIQSIPSQAELRLGKPYGRQDLDLIHVTNVSIQRGVPKVMN